MAYINLIGIDGSGKSTIFHLLKNRFPDAVFTREPGGTAEAEIIRDILLNKDMNESERINAIKQVMTLPVNQQTKKLLKKACRVLKELGLDAAEPYLFAASRSESIEKVILPALKAKQTIFGNRSVACSVAYQGAAKNFGADWVWKLNFDIVKDALPSLEIFFDLPVDVALSRISNREKQDRLDILDAQYLNKVRKGYLDYYQSICPYPYIIIDATKSVKEIENTVLDIIFKVQIRRDI